MIELEFEEEENDYIDRVSESLKMIGNVGISFADACDNFRSVHNKKSDDAETDILGNTESHIKDMIDTLENEKYFVSDESGFLIGKKSYLFDTMIEGMSNSDYHAFGGLSSTKFPLMDLSIRAFEYRHLFDFGKPVFDEGNLCHDCILLPELVENGYIESPTRGLDTLQAKQLREENPDKMVVGQGDIEKYKNIAKLVRLIVHFINFETTKKEVSFFHKHKETGLIFQIRPDIYNPKLGLLYDVKSTKANNHREFNKIIEEYNYDLSIAFYFDVLIMCGYKVNIDYVGWVCVPKSKPNIPFVFRCSQELLEKGRSKYQRLLTKYIEYKESEKELGKNDANLIYSDIAEKVAHSFEYRKQNYI